MIFLLCLVLLKNDIGLFTSDSKGFTMTSINNKEHIIALPITVCPTDIGPTSQPVLVYVLKKTKNVDKKTT